MKVVLTNIQQALQLVAAANGGANVVFFAQTDQKRKKVQQFSIIIFARVRKNRNAIVQLKPETLNQIVDYYNIFEFSVLNNSQIFNAMALLGLQATIPAKEISDILMLFVEPLNDGLSIAFDC